MSCYSNATLRSYTLHDYKQMHTVYFSKMHASLPTTGKETTKSYNNIKLPI